MDHVKEATKVAEKIPDTRKMLQMYKERMQEAKQRLQVVQRLGEGALIYDHPTVECIYLQFRIVLELIATASLSVNPDANSELAKKGRRKWHAGDILEAVQAINPKYYFPKPTRLIEEEGSKFAQVEGFRGEHREFAGDYLTRERFTSLYDLCSSALHTPNPFDRRARGRDRKANERLLRQAGVWHRRIWNLLCHHHFFLADDDDTMYVCHLQPDGGFNVTPFQKVQGINAADSTLAELTKARAKMLAGQSRNS